MKKEEFNNDLINFIEESTSSFLCVNKIKEILKKNNYKELYESDDWNNLPNKFYITRNDSSIIAIDLSNNKTDKFSIVTSHCDTPSLLLKPNGAYNKDGYLKYNVMPYGGLLNYGWLDHTLSLSGRVIIKEDNKLISKMIDLKEPILIVPSVAIHQNDNANTNLDLNMQIDLQPTISLSDNKDTWDIILKKYINGDIIDYDLFAYNLDKSYFIGNNKELLISPRIDNITSVYTSLISFIETKSDNIKVLCSFNNEEIGSLTEEGADSNFLLDILKKVAALKEFDITSSLSSSMIVSSDNTHAIHPNHSEYADNTGVAYLNKGFTIIKEINSTTNALSSSIIKTICDKHKIKYQYSTSKNDIAGGSTLSGISLRHVSVLSIDVGIPELSMHSSVETCSINDIYELYKMMKYFYQTKINRNKDQIDVL